MSQETAISDIAEKYYDSKNADEFYHTVWGGEDIHIGLYERSEMPISEASQRTVAKMASVLGEVKPQDMILDIGAGYGGAARYLARLHQCKVYCLNISEVENRRNKIKNLEQEFDHLVTVLKGDFEDLPFKEGLFDMVWSQDAILHSGNKSKVFEEVSRVLKKGGKFVFTDPMQSDDCPEGVLQPILERIHLKQMGSVKLYRELGERFGLSLVEAIEMPEQLVNHYSSVLSNLIDKESVLLSKGCEPEYINKMKAGLEHWVNGGKNGYLNWGILKFEKQ